MRILVIGGGITGLTAAFYLKRAGHDVAVYEASQRPGGAITTIHENGWLVEGGPNSINVTDGTVPQLIEDAGLTDRALEADRASARRYLVRDERVFAAPSSLLSAIGTPLLSLRAKLRILKEPWVPKIPAETEETLAAMVMRRLGPEPLNYLVNPFVGGIYAGKPEHLSVKYAFPRLYTLEQEYGSFIRGALKKKRSGPSRRIVSFRTGLSELTDRLALLLGESWHPSTPVTHVERTDKGYLVNEHVFDRVVFTAPFHVLTEMALQNLNTRPIPEIPYAPVISCSMGFKRSDIAHPVDGFGMLVPESEPYQILGTLFPSAIFPERTPSADHVLLTTFLGGSRRPELTVSDDETVTGIILKDLEALLGVSGAPEFVRIFRWKQAIPQYRPGFGSQLAWMDAFEAANPGFLLAGNFRTGISLDACIQAAKNVSC